MIAHPTRLAAVSVATVTLGLAVWVEQGTLAPAAIAWLTVATLVTLVAAAGLRVPLPARASYAIAAAAAVAGSIAMVRCRDVEGLLDPTKMGLLGDAGADALRTWWAIASASTALLVVVVAAPPRASRIAFGLLLATQAALGAWLLTTLPRPTMDSLMFQQQSWLAFRDGVNPYGIAFRDPYPPELSAQFYGEGLSVNGRLLFGFPYMPLTLFLSGPGGLAGDVRWSSLGAIVIGAALLGFAHPSRVSRLAGALLVTSPAYPTVAIFGWSDAYVVLTVALVHFCRLRWPRALPLAAGLMLVSKQYMVLAIPALLLLAPRPLRWRSAARFAAIAAGAGAAVTLPLVVGNPEGFLRSAVLCQIRQPFRPDALSYLAWFAPADPARWAWLCFVAGALGWAIVVARRRAVRPELALALALVFTLFFVTAKQAFANYYFFVIALLACAVGASAPDEPTAQTGGAERAAPGPDEAAAQELAGGSIAG